MQIQLRQTEIVEALKQFVTKQGITLTGKVVDITFTAGRKESGISADISIEEPGEIPGFEDAPTEDVVKPTLTVVVNDVAVSETPVVVVAAPTETPAPTPATASLFS